MSEPWLLKDLTALKGLTAVIPFLMSGFAFAYVVGYFLAFDLAWFPFFSLSEHIVFAIRALPIAVAAIVSLLAFGEAPELPKRAIWVWIFVLGLAAFVALISRYLGLFITFIVIMIATIIRHNKSQPSSTSATMPYLLAHMMIMSIIIGYLSGNVWRFDSIINPYLPISLSRAMHVHLNGPQDDNKPLLYVGHPIFVGSSRLLFYDYKSNKAVLLRWDKVERVDEAGFD